MNLKNQLIKTTLEKGPQNKQFYSNLSITKPIHDNLEIQSGLGEGLSYLHSCFDPSNGFQSSLYTSRNCAIGCEKVYPNFSFGSSSSNFKETLTSVLALDLLFNPHDDQLITHEFQEAISSTLRDIQEVLQDFIVPSLGLSTFNIFKESQSPTPDVVLEDPRNSSTDPEDFDSGNDSPSPTLMTRSQKDSSHFLPENFPDDINTTALTLSVLLHQGLLKPKPVESVLRCLISNSFTISKCQTSSQEESKESSSSEENLTLKMFPSLEEHEQGSSVSDPVAVANFLHLMYLLDISHEALLQTCEEFLLVTLKEMIASSKLTSASTSSQQSSSSSTLGNTNAQKQNMTMILSSDNEQNLKQTTEQCFAETTQTEAMGELPESESSSSPTFYSLLHHSPDSLLYFLSRSLAITKCCSSSRSRVAHQHFKMLLLQLLDIRLGATVDGCDLAMRILAGIYLGVLNNKGDALSGDGCKQDNEQRLSMQSLRMSNLLQKEFELLVSLQNMDGSWPPDSIVQIGFYNNGNSFSFKSKCGGSGDAAAPAVVIHDEEDENTIIDAEKEIVGYLGSKELTTLFAVKAISAFVNCKKHGIIEEEDEEDSESEKDDVDVHYLY
ncbi:unnamed protein product [Orchesella dallaii]|uniref:Uncharacterized protein n=1 Tax=Orchesella dallaii TaxID=48710 RepID=A0ABP1QPZ3_9HEXA